MNTTNYNVGNKNPLQTNPINVPSSPSIDSLMNFALENNYDPLLYDESYLSLIIKECENSNSARKTVITAMQQTFLINDNRKYVPLAHVKDLIKSNLIILDTNEDLEELRLYVTSSESKKNNEPFNLHDFEHSFQRNTQFIKEYRNHFFANKNGDFLNLQYIPAFITLILLSFRGKLESYFKLPNYTNRNIEFIDVEDSLFKLFMEFIEKKIHPDSISQKHFPAIKDTELKFFNELLLNLFEISPEYPNQRSRSTRGHEYLDTHLKTFTRDAAFQVKRLFTTIDIDKSFKKNILYYIDITLENTGSIFFNDSETISLHSKIDECKSDYSNMMILLGALDFKIYRRDALEMLSETCKTYLNTSKKVHHLNKYLDEGKKIIQIPQNNSPAYTKHEIDYAYSYAKKTLGNNSLQLYSKIRIIIEQTNAFIKFVNDSFETH